jgi:hypothetical protein
MAYPTVSAPYGLKPINLIGGQVFAGATRLLNIASGYATSIFYGDVVQIDTAGSGTIVKDTGNTTANPVGVFLGCSYVNSQGQTIFTQYFPANTTAPTGTTITAYVADDPDQLFKVVLVAGTTVDGNGLTPAYLGRTMIGSNAQLVQNTGSTVTGDSKVAIYTAAGATTTATLPIRIIDVVPDTANSSGNFCEVIVKWNAPNVTGQTVAGGHQYLNPTGV